jgi:hypothetical protein
MILARYVLAEAANEQDAITKARPALRLARVATWANVSHQAKLIGIPPEALDVSPFPWLMCVNARRVQPFINGETQMTTSDKNGNEKVLRETFRNMDAYKAQAIREAYYKAVEGLQTLAAALEIADVEVGEQNDHALINEHLLACLAMDAMNKSVLGRIL